LVPHQAERTVVLRQEPGWRGMQDKRFVQVDDHIFRLAVDRPDEPAEVLRDGEWVTLVLTNQEVLSLINVKELTPDEVRELGLPD
jgi:hypothetical protein